METKKTGRLVKLVEGEKRLCVSYSQIETFKQCPYKWYLSYVEGLHEDERQEALSYGSVMHKTLEFFFNNKRIVSPGRLSQAFNYYSRQEDIPWNSIESMLKAGKDAAEMLGWLSRICRFHNGKFDVPDGEVDWVANLIRYGKIEGVEEGFCLPYRLPGPVSVAGDDHLSVWLNGSVDLHLSLLGRHYVIDWKSGNTLFDEKKLATNLQHPIYSFYIMRRYGVMPEGNLYFFTRKIKHQRVTVDRDRIKKSVEDLNATFSEMYEIDKGTKDTFRGYFNSGTEESPSYKWYNCKLKEPVRLNRVPCPSALCYYCEFGKYNRNLCRYSSDWDPTKKKK